MAAGVALPQSVFGHGFVYNRGEKMSKTIGNIVDPINLANFFGADALRYLLLREIAFDRDGDFTVELFVTRYNAELANELGNLFSRTLMTGRYRRCPVFCNEVAETAASPTPPPITARGWTPALDAGGGVGAARRRTADGERRGRSEPRYKRWRDIRPLPRLRMPDLYSRLPERLRCGRFGLRRV
jgi:hypothetical protein